ncbi:hypothetical protein B0T24DRAFT_528600 [Lasiosphaeria ovina]|uniref:NAD(P)-binding domain-containing protein n=1 Tax=Lasiosphaeria ovina TaxID=92902 RepID=A0AAE0KBN6_9PEZI|nr:hypothetical protein B0T24DRAFT_528600 [Lasiosphaeria ovina]
MSAPESSAPKAVFFLGATGGCGFATLRRCIEAGYACVALCRVPYKLTDKLSPKEREAVRIDEGNADDGDAVRRCLAHPSRPGAMVDYVISSIGNEPSLQGMRNADSDVCRKGMDVLLQTIQALRADGVAGRPRIVGISSTGLSSFARDLPLLMVPLYKVVLAIPHCDKKAMEDLMIASGEDWTVIRASGLTNGRATAGGSKVRAGMEIPQEKKVETEAIGYTISREDVGRWIFEKIVQEDQARAWVQRVATITH